MTSEKVLASLELPAACRVDRRVPKRLLVENGARTAPDKKAINESVEEVTWAAALKPTNVGVAPHRDADREYAEIAVLRVVLRGQPNVERLTELVHRAIPYPLLLLTEGPDCGEVSAAHKRWSQGEEGKAVLDGNVSRASWRTTGSDSIDEAFVTALALGIQPNTSFLSLYQGWLDVLLAKQIAALTGSFVVSRSPQDAESRRVAMRSLLDLEARAEQLRAAAAQERQMQRLVEWNLELRRIKAEIDAVRTRI